MFNPKSIFQEILNSNHHAFLITSIERESLFELVKNEIRNISKNNSENLFLNVKQLDIEKVREIIKYGESRFDELHYVVISFHSALAPAQNTFLKFLEEPARNIKIVLIVSSSTDLIETVRSRVYSLDSGDSSLTRGLGVVSTFLKTKKTERMKLKEVIEILEKEDIYAKEIDKKERKDREAAEEFLLEIEKELYLLLESKIESKEFSLFNKEAASEARASGDCILKNLLDIQDFKKYIKLPSSSPKNIFEYLSLSVVEI